MFYLYELTIFRSKSEKNLWYFAAVWTLKPLRWLQFLTLSLLLRSECLGNDIVNQCIFTFFLQMGDSQSVHSYRTVENPDCQSMAAIDDGVSLRSLPITKVGTIQLNPPRSMSPVSSMSGDELSHGGRRSQRRRPLLDKQVLKRGKTFGVSLLSHLICYAWE